MVVLVFEHCLVYSCFLQNNIYREAQTMILVDHANVLKSHCSFVSDHNLWVVMPFMAGGSCLHILKAAYPDGFEEVVIATILREILKGLEYLHHHGHIHRDVKVSMLTFNIIQIFLCCVAGLGGQISKLFLCCIVLNLLYLLGYGN